jgi:hypothetical protein
MGKADPTGTTCTLGSDKKYSCQVDAMSDAKGNITQRADFSKDQVKQVAAFEKSYTKAVNELADHPDRIEPLNIPGGKTVNVPAAAIAGKLADTSVTAFPTVPTLGRDGAMASFSAFQVGVYGEGLKGNRGYGESAQVLHDADLRRQVAIVHEGMHWTRADQNVPNFDSSHQTPFNQTAEAILGLDR